MGDERGRRFAAGAVVGVHVRVTAQRELHYRANFFVNLTQSAVQALAGLAAVWVVFSRTDELNGWTRDELYVAVGVFTIVGGVLRAFVQPPLTRFTEEIGDGTFDFVLVKPIDAQLLMSVREFDMWQLLDVVVGAIVLAVVVPRLGGLGAVDGLGFLVTLAAGCAIAYGLWLLLACCAFWITTVPYLGNVFYYVSRAGQYPVGIYPAWMRAALTFVVPLGIAVSVPAEALTSRLDGWRVATVVAVAVVVFGLSRFVWRLGVRRYAGASA